MYSAALDTVHTFEKENLCVSIFLFGCIYVIIIFMRNASFLLFLCDNVLHKIFFSNEEKLILIHRAREKYTNKQKKRLACIYDDFTAKEN
jgi:hypothetical protein